jgi:hypothetical protein
MLPRILLVLAFLAAVATGTVGQAQPQDPIPQPIPQSPIQVNLTPVVTGLTSPIDLSVIGRGEDDDNGNRDGNDGRRGRDRKFIVDQTGLILLLKGGVLQTTPVLDITRVIAQISPAFGSGPPA